MDEVKQYKTAGAFRTALETRLQIRAQEERTDLQRLRRQVAFDRFLARLFPKGPKGTYPWVLKGGYAMDAADSFGTNDERHRSDATRRNSADQTPRRTAEADASDATRLSRDPTQ
jgi:hypothetical protein